MSVQKPLLWIDTARSVGNGGNSVMNHNYLFGITKKAVESFKEVRRGTVISGGDTKIISGTPCLILTGSVDDIGRDDDPYKTPYGVLPFPSSMHLQTRYTFGLNTWSPIVRVGEVTDIIEKVKQKEVERFDIEQIESILSYVETNNRSLTLTITDNKCTLVEDLLNLDIRMRKINRHSFLLQHSNVNMSGFMKEPAVCCVSFMNIPDFLPIFYPKKVSGVMVNINVVYPGLSDSYDKLVSSFELTIVYTQNRDNFVDIDGSNTGLIELEDKNHSACWQRVKKASIIFELVGYKKKESPVKEKQKDINNKEKQIEIF